MLSAFNTLFSGKVDTQPQRGGIEVNAGKSLYNPLITLIENGINIPNTWEGLTGWKRVFKRGSDRADFYGRNHENFVQFIPHHVEGDTIYLKKPQWFTEVRDFIEDNDLDSTPPPESFLQEESEFYAIKEVHPRVDASELATLYMQFFVEIYLDPDSEFEQIDSMIIDYREQLVLIARELNMEHLLENIDDTDDEYDDDDMEMDHPREDMNIVTQNVKRRAEELDKLEQDRKRARRESDPRIQKCKQMNESCLYRPIDMEDWCEHDEKTYYGPDDKGKCFDLQELAQHFEAKLTAEKYGSYYPLAPFDPFDRYIFTKRELMQLLRHMQISGVNAPLFYKYVLFVTQQQDPSPYDGKELDYNARQKVIDEVLPHGGA
jgi:hypothetical protein